MGGPESVVIDRDGSLRGTLVVLAGRGQCAQQPYTRRATPARYLLGVGCMACLVVSAEFRLLRPE